MSGSGKTILSSEIAKIYKDKTKKIPVVIDGDALRETFSDKLGYTKSDRIESSYRKSRLAKLFFDQGHFIICSLVCLYPEVKKWIKSNIGKNKFIFIETPINDLIKRDGKGLYKGALNGEILNVAGINLDFPIQTKPDYHIINNGTKRQLLEHSTKILKLCKID